MKKVFFTLLLILPVTAQAAGIQASPAQISIRISGGQTVTQKLVVANPTTDVQLYEVYPDNFSNFISVFPGSFTLEAGEKQNVELTIKCPIQTISEILTTNISVLTKPLASPGLETSTGIKIPLTITIAKGTEMRWPPYLWVYGGIIVVVLGLSAYFQKHKNSMN